MVATKSYSLVISDWNMAGITGLDLVRDLRARERTRNVPFIMTSIDGTRNRFRVAHKAGVTAFLLKPFDLSVFRAKLEEILRHAPVPS